MAPPSSTSFRPVPKTGTPSVLYPKGPAGPPLMIGSGKAMPPSLFDDLAAHIAENKGFWAGAAVLTGLTVGGIAAWYKSSLGGQRKERAYMDMPFRKRSKSSRKSRSKDRGGDEKPMGVLIFHQCPRGRRTPCIAPFPLKFETFLRVYGINYEVSQNGAEPKQSGSPWITLDMEDIADMQNCFKFVCSKYGIDSEKNLSEMEKSMSRAYQHMLENHLYWGIALWRWVYNGAASLKDIQILPQKTVRMIPDVCRTVEQAAWFHGIGKKDSEDVIESVIEDLKALSDFLGDKKFFLGGENATMLDCSAFSMLSQILWNMDECPYRKAMMESHQNLCDFCLRVKSRYWPDWDQCLNNTVLTATTSSDTVST